MFSTIERDIRHRPHRIIDVDGYETIMTYAGPRVDVVGRGGKQTSYWRNLNSKVTRISRWVGGEEQATLYRYDEMGRMTTIINALGEETRVAYDMLDRRTRLDDPNAGSFQYRYDGAGRMTEQLAPGNDLTTFQYNPSGDMVEKRFSDGDTVTISYGEPGDANAIGMVTAVADEAGTLELAYDIRGNIIQRQRTVSGQTFLTGYAYDSIGHLRRTTYPDGFVVEYGYDAGGNIAALFDGEGRQIASGFKYSATGQLLNIAYGNGVRSTFTYSDMAQMNSIHTSTQAGASLQDLLYVYDPTGNITTIEDNAFGHSQSFVYDDISRLVQAAGGYGERIYAYDAIDNLVRKHNMRYEMDPQHLQRVIKARLLEPSGGIDKRSYDVAYDRRGNVAAKFGRRYEYSTENRLRRILGEDGKFLEENRYDFRGQRVSQKTRKETTLFIDGIYERGKTHDSRHIYAGPLLVSTIVTPKTKVRLVDEVAPAFLGLAEPGLGHGWSAFARKHSVAFGAGGLVTACVMPWFLLPGAFRRRVYAGVDEMGKRIRMRPLDTLVIALLIPVFLVVSTVPAGAVQKEVKSFDWSSGSVKRYYYHANHLGSINVVTDQLGGVVEQRDYTPFGEPVDWTGPQSGPKELLLTFNSQRYDDNSGLYYFGARYYDAELGRFMTPDTILPDPMNPRKLNRYAFAGGNPVRYSDPTGHDWFDIVMGVLVVVAAIVVTGLLVVAAIITAGASSWTVGLGVGLILGAVAIAVGLVVGSGFAIAAAVTGSSWLEIGRAFATGFLLGMVVTAGVFAFVLALAPTGGMSLAIVTGILIGAAFGATTSTIDHFMSGGGPDTMFWGLFSGVAWGAVIGGITAGIGDKLIGGALNAMKFSFQTQSMLAFLIGTGLTLWDVTDGIVLQAAFGFSVGGFIQSFPYQFAMHTVDKGMTLLWGNNGAGLYNLFYGTHGGWMDTVFGTDSKMIFTTQPNAG